MVNDAHYNNPYVFGLPVDDPDLFFGRELELSIMMNTIAHLKPGLRQSMAVVGPRRIGKTSLLHQIIRQMQSTSNAIAMIDTQEIVPRSALLLTRIILGRLREAIEKKFPDIAQTQIDIIDKPPPPGELVFHTFQEDMRRLNEALASGQKPATILMIDEVEGLLEFGGLQVLGLFRHLAQKLPHILFVVAGADRLYSLMNDTTSPFFNVFKIVTIKPLSDNHAREMILEPATEAGIQFDTDATSEVIRLSGGIPYLINMICHYATEKVLLQHSPPVIKKFHIDRACEHILTHEHGYFRYTWQQAQSLEQAIFYTLAEARTAQPVEQITRRIEQITRVQQASDQIHEYVRELEERQILCRNESGDYWFGNELLPLWLRANYTVTKVAQEFQSTAAVLGPGETPNFDVQPTPSELRQVLTALFSESELRDIMFDLKIDFESLAGSSKSDKARELISFMHRRKRLDELVDAVRIQHPHAFD
jgi:hypothetical protein